MTHVSPGPRVRALSAQALESNKARVTFENGVTRVIDLAPYLHGPIFSEIRSNPATFQSMHIEGGAVTWDNGADIDPDVLYYNLAPARMSVETLTTD